MREWERKKEENELKDMLRGASKNQLKVYCLLFVDDSVILMNNVEDATKLIEIL